MKPYYQDEWVTIYHGDCRDLAHNFYPDVVLADPPYKDGDVDADYYRWFEHMYNKLRFITKDYLIFFNNSSRLYKLMQFLGEPHRILVWTKGIVKYAWRWEPILIYSSSNPSFKINKNIFSDHLRTPFSGNLAILFFYLYADAVAVEFLGGEQCCTTAHKRVEDGFVIRDISYEIAH